jgi:hypothetical protein
MVPLLFIRDGDQSWAVVVDHRTRLGRAAKCDVHLKSPGVSHRHAEIQWINDVAWICDLGSLNGTWINGQRIAEPTKLHVGDALRMGDVRLTYRVVAHVARGLDPIRGTGDLGGMVTFCCPACRTRLAARLDMLHSVHLCPHCEAAVIVPDPDQAPPTGRSTEAKMPVNFEVASNAHEPMQETVMELELDAPSPSMGEDDAAAIWAESFRDDEDGDAGAPDGTEDNATS